MESRSIKKIVTAGLYLISALILLYVGLSTVDYLTHESGSIYWFHILRACCLSVSALILICSIYSTIRILKTRWLENLLVLMSSPLLLFIALEVFLTVYPLSSGGDDILTSTNWFSLYWEENSLGYRDEEPELIDRSEKQNVLVLGDSYVAGHGIRDAKDRFTDICSNRLKEYVDVFNLGICGVDTKDELQMLRSFPITPDLVVLVHFVNDIGDSPTKDQRLSGDIHARYPKRLCQNNFLIRKSILFNYLEFLFYQFNVSKFFKSVSSLSLGQLLATDLGRTVYLSSYTNDSLLEKHLVELEEIYDWCRKKDIKVQLVLFPNLMDNYYHEIDSLVNIPISSHAESQNVQVLNLTPLFEDLQENQRMVGPTDSHPSRIAHRIVADTLSTQILMILRDQHLRSDR